MIEAAREAPHGTGAKAALTLGALGVVFGDIGTSPIYTVQTVFNPSDPHPVPVSQAHIYGVVSLIFWSVTLIVTIKYVAFVLRADNDGEGGIMALITLIRQEGIPGQRRLAVVLASLGIFGAALFFGDSVITPAISVLSAVEGIKIVDPSLDQFVVPISIVIIAGLFASQRLGSAVVGRLFGPVMLVWFAAIGACGIGGVARDPHVLQALSPSYALDFLFGDFGTAFFSLSAVVLAITGAEALYADLGHFGRGPIRRAWLLIVFPACILSYLGQGALILDEPKDALRGPFFLLVPEWGRVPMVVLATMATVIASQAVLSGAFSITHQAIQLGYLPRLRILHTSAKTIGQVYVPLINWVLMFSVLTLVVTFRSSAALAAAYGMTVTVTIATTTILFLVLAHYRWGQPLWRVLLGGLPFLGIELLFLAANLTKITHGAWLPLLIGLSLFTVLTTWQRGRELVSRRRERKEGSLRAYVERLHEDLSSDTPSVYRAPGTAVFLNRSASTTPLAMRANVERNHVLHENVLVLSIEIMPVPYVSADEHIAVDDLGYEDDGIVHASARFGYMQGTHVPEVLRRAVRETDELSVDANETTYFLSTIELTVSDRRGMARWRKHLFVATARVATDPVDAFHLPRDQTLTVGSQIEV
ncbi:MAG TPA: potassium transporter Kup [Nocardioidaceae bacterium]|nr:potassium transporter Kup [Nocardioidaceae bacterium]